MDLSNSNKLKSIDYHLNNDSEYVNKYSFYPYPRLVEYLFDQEYGDSSQDIDKKSKKDDIYRQLLQAGLFKPC